MRLSILCSATNAVFRGHWKTPTFLAGVFFLLYMNNSYTQNDLKHAKRMPLYCVIGSANLVILLIFATNAVKYICNSIANNPVESALRNPWASFNSPFFSSTRWRIFIRSLKYSLASNSSLSWFFYLPAWYCNCVLWLLTSLHGSFHLAGIFGIWPY